MYKLLLLAPDGEYVMEGPCETIEDCEDMSEDMGSRWIFYPFHFVIKDHGQLSMTQRIIRAPDSIDHLAECSVKTTLDYIKENGKKILEFNSSF